MLFWTSAFVTCFDKKEQNIKRVCVCASEVAKRSLNVAPHASDVFLSDHVWVGKRATCGIELEGALLVSSFVGFR